MREVIKLFTLTILLFLLPFGLLMGQEKEALIFDKFPIEKTLKGENYFNPDTYIQGMRLYEDSLLLIRNDAPDRPHHFSLWNLHKKKYRADLLKSGRKSDEVLSFISYGIYGHNLWAYDIIKNRVSALNIDSTHKKEKAPSLLNKPVSDFYYSVQMLNDSILIGSGDYDSAYRLHKINLNTGKIIEQLGPYPTDSTSAYSRPEKMAYESFLYVKPTHDKCVLAARYADQIQLFNLETSATKIVKGPENFEPEVITIKGNDGKELSTRGAKTRYAFVSGTTTNRFIYLLYSGNNHRSEHHSFGKYIYIYDWEGNPVEKITLSSYVASFVVTSDDQKIYLYDPYTQFIKTANLKMP